MQTIFKNPNIKKWRKWSIYFILFLIFMLIVDSCGQKKYVSKNLQEDVELVSTLETENGVKLVVSTNNVVYNLNLEKIGRTFNFWITNESGEIGLLAAYDDDDGDKRSTNIFVVFEESGFNSIALNLANREFVKDIILKRFRTDKRFNSNTFFRMLPSEKSNGGIIVIPKNGGAFVAMMDNGFGSSGSGCGGGSPDSVSNACKAAIRAYQTCKGGPNICKDLLDEARLRCTLTTNSNIGSFSQ